MAILPEITGKFSSTVKIFRNGTEERAHLGLFMSFQYPLEIPGVSNAEFLYAAKCALCKARNQPIPSKEEFQQKLAEKMTLLEMKSEFNERSLNEGFSGGEKKRNEILQMSLLGPILPFR
jgi:Fe-S cluster assembly ATP-binding protein